MNHAENERSAASPPAGTAIAPPDCGITSDARAAIAAAARAAFPHEMVGVLGGRHGTIAAVVPLPNRAASAVAFAVEPAAFAAAEHALRTRGLAFLGFAHSHPNGAAAPSAADRAAFWPGCLQAIAAVDARGTVLLRVFWRHGETVAPVALAAALARDGYELHDDALDDTALAGVERALGALPPGGRAGRRHLLRGPAIAALAHDDRLLAIARNALGPGAEPFRATLFAKTPAANWLVAWHQDTALPFRARVDAPGYGPWSTKAGIAYAHAPTAALQRVLAVRVHLDPCGDDDGALRVLPGSHRLGVLDDGAAAAFAREHGAATVTVAAARGAALAMSPLVLHASAKGNAGRPRRVLHLEYAAAGDLPGGLALAFC